MQTTEAQVEGVQSVTWVGYQGKDKDRVQPDMRDKVHNPQGATLPDSRDTQDNQRRLASVMVLLDSLGKGLDRPDRVTVDNQVKRLDRDNQDSWDKQN